MKSFYKNQNLNLIASMAQQIVFNNSKNGKLESTNTQDAIDEISNILDEEKTMISDAWNSSTTYTVGQYCIYNDCLWKCKVQHSGQTPSEGTYWTKTQIDDEILAIKNDVSTLNSNLLKKLSAEVILNASNYMLLKIDNSYIFIGYLIKDINAWTWIVKLDEEYAPTMNITSIDGKIRLDTSGVIQTTTNIGGGTSYILFYTIIV